MIPPNKNQKPLSIVRGTTNAWGLLVTGENDAPYTLESDQALVFALKKDENDEERVLVKKITNSVNGEYYLELAAADTSNLKPGIYYYDVSLQHGDHVLYNVIEASPFVIKPNITQLGDGA